MILWSSLSMTFSTFFFARCNLILTEAILIWSISRKFRHLGVLRIAENKCSYVFFDSSPINCRIQSYISSFSIRRSRGAGRIELSYWISFEYKPYVLYCYNFRCSTYSTIVPYWCWTVKLYPVGTCCISLMIVAQFLSKKSLYSSIIYQHGCRCISKRF